MLLGIYFLLLGRAARAGGGDAVERARALAQAPVRVQTRGLAVRHGRRERERRRGERERGERRERGGGEDAAAGGGFGGGGGGARAPSVVARAPSVVAARLLRGVAGGRGEDGEAASARIRAGARRGGGASAAARGEGGGEGGHAREEARASGACGDRASTPRTQVVALPSFP